MMTQIYNDLIEIRSIWQSQWENSERVDQLIRKVSENFEANEGVDRKSIWSASQLQRLISSRKWQPFEWMNS